MAGGFAAFGLIAALAVTVKEQEEEVAEAAADQNTAEVVTDAAAWEPANAMDQHAA